MIRQSAFGTRTKLLKGALHSHTTRSDGDMTPEELIAMHEHYGYDFMALTDHRKYNFKNYLPGSKMTIIPGMEMDRNIADDRPVHTFHSVWLGREKPNNPYEQDQVIEKASVKDQFEFQKVLDEGHANGQLTVMCHPQWSGTFVREFDQLKGNFAIELWNTGCALENGADINNGWIWDELLMQGQKIYGIAVDDGHEAIYHCQGWVMVNAENNVDAILDALKNGAFYASTGPEIFDFWIDDENVAHVKCSACRYVRFHCAASISKRLFSENGQPIMEASMPMKECYHYLRVEVTDMYGRVAWSNPIFLGK